MLFNIKEYRLSARVEHAPDGQWIAASEWQVREIFQKLMSESYQQMLQARMDAAPQAAFSPSRPPPAQGQRQASGPRAYRRRLDSYHLAQHVHEAARCCLGEGEAARAWAGARLKDVKQGGAKA
ncbi:MAG TPA: hypothetical protein VG269_11545, partial [Tepidisphaeraceae bacterium]|nr:hypothetical protein [Tepidisphaeraceae bacterium]